MTARRIVSGVVGCALLAGIVAPAGAQVRRRIITTEGSMAVQSQPFVVKGDIRCPDGFAVQLQGRARTVTRRRSSAASTKPAG
ncbi:MAG: hypothetical protein KIT14_06200 [bacterium]|nr:hypothetical protein [bacterium]